MKITKIKIRNFLGITDFVVDSLGKFNQVEGDNAVGKSSFIKAIRAILSKGSLKADVIHLGKDKAEIAIEIDDRIKIQRNVTERGDTRKVTVDGETVSTAVSFVQSLFGEYSLDPTKFFLAKPRERRQMLLSSIDFTISEAELRGAIGEEPIPIDLAEFDYKVHGLTLLDAVKAKVYNLRGEVNRDVIRKKKAIEQDKLEIPETFDVKKFEGYDVSKKMDRLDDMKRLVVEHTSEGEVIARLRTQRDNLDAAKTETETTIKQLQSKLIDLESSRIDIEDKGRALLTKHNKFVAPDTTALRSEINEFNDSRKLILKLEQIAEREKGLEKETESHENLDILHKALVDDVRIALMSKIKLPVEGLAIDGDNITVNGVSLDNLSTSEQLTFGIEVARVQAKDLKAILADDWEHMSKKNRKEFEKIVRGDGFQYCMAVVTEGELSMISRGEVESK